MSDRLKLKKRKPPPVPVPKPPPASAGPIFVATFADGVTTRMSVYSEIEPLDLERGITIAKAAYSSRTGTPMSAIAVGIAKAHFETSDGAVLTSYPAEQLEGGNKREEAS